VAGLFLGLLSVLSHNVNGLLMIEWHEEIRAVRKMRWKVWAAFHFPPLTIWMMQ
jgi:hypothetical protein